MNKLIIFFGLIFSIISCNTTEPPPPDEKSTLTLTLEDASSIEAWIKLTTNNLQLPATVNLEQNNTVTQDIILSYADTVIYIDSLLPNQQYTFQAITQSSNQSITSNELSVTTMDTTSHNFNWQTFTFGENSSSVLNDVAIIDENNIWAVGEIYMNDSLGNPDPNAYNAVHWDGTQWTVKKITVLFRNNLITPPLYSVFAFSDNDIWFSSGVPIHGDGENWTQYHLFDMGILDQDDGSLKKIWGNNSNDIYFVGNRGTIVRYNGSVWTRIESGTELNIGDIWGDYNEKTGEWEILAVASNFGSSLEKEILQIKNKIVIKIPTSSQMWPLKTVWFISYKQYYVAGAGIYQKRLLTDSLWKNEALDITTYSTYSIRGNNINDIIGVGAFGDFIHFNGVSWKNDYEEPNLGFGSYKSVNIKGNIIYAVGDDYSRAVILKIKR